MKATIGYAHFFEHTVIYGSVSDLLSVLRSRNAKAKHGNYLGTVLGLIPVDPHRVLYEYHTHTKSFLKRQKLKRHFRKLGITRKERKSLQPLTNFF